MSVTPEKIKQLRELSGAGLLDCRNALAETGGDIEKAKDLLRAKGVVKAAKKAVRVATEGLVALATRGNKAALVEVNSETDFVARNEKFQKIAASIASVALDTNGTVEAVKSASYPGTGRSVEAELTELVGVIGENISLRRAAVGEVSQGVVATYIHNAAAPNLGKIGVLVALESSGDQAKLTALGKQIAMHIAASRPDVLAIADVTQESLEREKAVYAEQAKASGKPDNVIAKMVEGRIRKYYEEAVLLEQPFVLDPQTKISAVIEQASKDIGAPVVLKSFVRFELGEGIEKEETDFAREVRAAIGQ